MDQLNNMFMKINKDSISIDPRTVYFSCDVEKDGVSYHISGLTTEDGDEVDNFEVMINNNSQDYLIEGGDISYYGEVGGIDDFPFTSSELEEIEDECIKSI